jgi:hypothetical protein
MARWLKRIGEPFLFGLDPLVAPAYLARYNLHAVSHLGPADLGRLYLATADGHPPSKMLGHVSIIEGRSPGTASVSGSGDSL